MKSFETIARKCECIFPEKIIQKIRPLFYGIESFLLKKDLISLDDIYGTDFFKNHHDDKRINENLQITTLIYNKFKPNSVVDFGCGIGSYLYFFSKFGISKLKGFEGSKKAIELAIINKGYIERCDISKKIDLNEKYDICICFEVAEHLNEDCVETFLDNLCSSSDTILFTAAPPNQGGRHHVNLKPIQYWTQKFKERHYNYQTSLTDEFKKDLDNKVDTMPWMKNNLMIFQNNFL